MFHINIRENKGQTIVEAAVALASILITLAAISIVVTTSVNNSRFVSDQSVALRHAQDGIEYVRNLNGADPEGFANLVGIKCMAFDNSMEDTTCPTPNIDNTFIREVEFIQGATECGARPTTPPSSEIESGTQVVVTVKWSSGKCNAPERFCHKSSLASCFSTGTASSGL